MIIGIEGVSCTGKTTVAVGLAARIGPAHVVPCYYHVAPDPSVLPGPDAASETDQIAALTALLDVEELRAQRAWTAAERGCHVVMDRTVDTLLAHVHAVGSLRGLDARGRARALVDRRIAAGQVVVPDVTVVLTAVPDELARRAYTRIDMPGLYYAPDFASEFLEHFTMSPVTPVCARIDAGRGADLVLADALRVLAPYVALKHEYWGSAPSAEGASQ